MQITDILTPPRPIRSDEDYDAAHEALITLIDRTPQPGTADHDLMELLEVLIKTYDEEHYTLDQYATPQEVIAFMLGQHDWSRADLAIIMGGRSRVSDFFAGKRDLSLGQIKKLRDALHVPADVLLPS